MAISIQNFKQIADQGYSRVKLDQDGVTNGKTSWLSRIVGIVSRQRTNENQKIHDAFAKALMREYGHAGASALSFREGNATRTALSSQDIRKMITIAKQEYERNEEKYAISRNQIHEPIATAEQYDGLPELPELMPGDILIKKHFQTDELKIIDSIITSVQRAVYKPDVVKMQSATEKSTHAFPNLGSSSSEHVAVAIGPTQIAEATGPGVEQRDVHDRAISAGTKYIVVRMKDTAMRDQIAHLARGFSDPDIPREQRIKYGAWGAIKSSWRTTVNRQEEAGKRIESGLKYALGERVQGDKMFCSEFAAVCIESAAMSLSPADNRQTALGVNPAGMSPMALEDVLNQRPDLFETVGRYTGGPRVDP